MEIPARICTIFGTSIAVFPCYMFPHHLIDGVPDDHQLTRPIEGLVSFEIVITDDGGIGNWLQPNVSNIIVASSREDFLRKIGEMFQGQWIQFCLGGFDRLGIPLK